MLPINARANELRCNDTTAEIILSNNETLYIANVEFLTLIRESITAFSSIKRVYCYQCNLTEVPPELFQLHDLESCVLPSNRITTIPVQFESTIVQTLDFTNNRLVKFPIEIWKMRQLKVLNLTRNAITQCTVPLRTELGDVANARTLTTLTMDDNPLIAFACNITSLETLSLQNTSLTAIPPVLFEMQHLKSLQLAQNPQMQLDINSTKCLSVELLNLANCNITTFPRSLQLALPRVTSLVLANNSILTTSDIEPISDSNVVDLNLDGNLLSNVDNISLKFSRLSNISLAFNNVTSCNLSTSQSIIQNLNLSHNAISACELFLPSLQNLDLQYNRLKTIPDTIFKHDKLRYLDLTGNPLQSTQLSSSQFTFLQQLADIRIDQSTFEPCTSIRRNLHGITVCLNPETPLPSPQSRTASTSTQVVYIIGSFLVALLIGLWIFRTMQRSPSSSIAGSINPYDISSPHLSDQDGSCKAQCSQQSSRDHITLQMKPSDQNDVQSNRSDQSLTASKHMQSLQHLVVPPSMVSLTSDEEEKHPLWCDEELLSWRVDFDVVTMYERLAVGTTSEVWRASYRMDVVAVKKLRAGARLMLQHHPDMIEAAVLDEFISEVRIMSRLNHPSLLAFYGVAWNRRADLMAIVEYMPQRDLRTWLRRLHVGALPWGREKLNMIQSVADALAYIHAMSPAIVHGNVKAANVLLDDNFNFKLSDFGSSCYCTPSQTTFGKSNASKIVPGSETTPWLPPEVLLGNSKIGPPMDVYGLGVLVVEIDTHQHPFASMLARDSMAMSEPTIQAEITLGVLQPEVSTACPREIRELVQQCLTADPALRPTSAEVARNVRRLIEEHPGSDYPFEISSHQHYEPSSGGSSVGARYTFEMKLDEA